MPPDNTKPVAELEEAVLNFPVPDFEKLPVILITLPVTVPVPKSTIELLVEVAEKSPLTFIVATPEVELVASRTSVPGSEIVKPPFKVSVWLREADVPLSTLKVLLIVVSPPTVKFPVPVLVVIFVVPPEKVAVPVIVKALVPVALLTFRVPLVCWKLPFTVIVFEELIEYVPFPLKFRLL